MRDYDSTVARIAGNLLSGAVRGDHYAALGRHGMDFEDDAMVRGAVLVARTIVTETQRTEPKLQEEESEKPKLAKRAFSDGSGW